MISPASSLSARTRVARAAALAAAAAAVVLGSLAVAAPASAHDRLVSSDPAADDAVETLPEQLVLVYSAELLDVGDGTAVEVEAPSGASVTDGDAIIDGTDVIVPLTEGTEAGEHTVTWRVVSSDGHPIDGTFGFTVENAAVPADEETEEPAEQETEEAPVEEPVTEDDAAEATADDSADADAVPTSLPWILGGLVAILAIGAATAAIIVKARRGAPGAGGSGSTGSDDTSGDDDHSSER